MFKNISLWRTFKIIYIKKKHFPFIHFDPVGETPRNNYIYKTIRSLTTATGMRSRVISNLIDFLPRLPLYTIITYVHACLYTT